LNAPVKRKSGKSSSPKAIRPGPGFFQKGKLFFFKPRVIGAVLSGVAFFGLYCYTQAPDVLASDCGDWEAAGATLGISHSPGSPAYTIISWIFSHVVLYSNMAARVNLVSAVVGAIGVAAVFVFMIMLFDRWLPALIAAATLGLGGQWWAHASVAQPYNAVVTIIAVLLILLLLWQRSGDVRLIWGGSFLTGFGLSYHPSLLYFTPVLMAGLFVLGPWRKVLKLKAILLTLVFLALGLSIYAYLPIRSATNPAITYGKIDSLSSFFNFISASDARRTGAVEPGVPGAEVLQDKLSTVVRQGYFPSYAYLTFAAAIILLYPAVWSRLKSRSRMLIFLFLGALVHMAIIFAVSRIYVHYYLPLLLYFSIWSGFSMFLIMTMAEAYIKEGWTRKVPVVTAAAVYIIVLSLGIPTIWPFVNHHEDLSMRDYANMVFGRAKPGAVILADWPSYGGLRYEQQVEGKRPDLEIISVSPENWRENLAEVRSQQPSQILTSHNYPFTKEDNAVTLSDGYRVSIKGRTYQDVRHGEPYPFVLQLFEIP
jgi:4-amino-4-deoxy-L-arabinose transferase-like glycosyltransferase